MLLNVSTAQTQTRTVISIPGNVFTKVEKEGPIELDECDEPRTIHVIVKGETSYEVLPRTEDQIKARATYYLELPITKTTTMGRMQAQQIIFKCPCGKHP